MATTNIFMNSYKQPENKLTYNFLCLLEHMDSSKEFFEYLLDNMTVLVNSPVIGIETVFGGNVSNPDGMLLLKSKDGEEYSIYIENKTYRYELDEIQIRKHLLTYCKENNSLLLVITPRISDKKIIDSIGNKKIYFKTWSQIANKLSEINNSLSHPLFLISQFIEYGELSGEFYDMENITNEEINYYIKTIKSDVERKIVHIFERLNTEINFEEYGFREVESVVRKHWGRHGIEVSFTPKNNYRQWLFFGILYEPSEHCIKFKKAGVPELALFFDYIPEHQQKKELKSKSEFVGALERLCKKEFEQNLTNKIAHQHRLVFWRKSLNDIDDFSYENIKTIFQEKLKTLSEEQSFKEEMF